MNLSTIFKNIKLGDKMSAKQLEILMEQNSYVKLAHIVRNDITCALCLMKKKDSEKAMQKLNITLQSLQGLIDKAIHKEITDEYY